MLQALAKSGMGLIMNKHWWWLFSFISVVAHAEKENIVIKAIEELKLQKEGSWVVIEEQGNNKDGFFVQCSRENKYIVCTFPILLYLKPNLPGNAYRTQHNLDAKLETVHGAQEQINADLGRINGIKLLANKYNLGTNNYYYKALNMNSELVGSGLDLDVAMKIDGKGIELFLLDYIREFGNIENLAKLSVRGS